MKSQVGTLFLVCLTLSAIGQGAIRVDIDATGNNDGTKWEHAFNDLSDAIDSAEDGDAIWIANGIYKPGRDMASPSSTFFIKKRIRLIGGFAGNELALGDRDVANNPVTLSGDHMDNDGTITDSISRVDNSLHVITVDSGIGSTIRLEDLIITGGNATTDDDFAGGGIYAQSPLLINGIQFTGNRARSGAGVALLGDGGSSSQIGQCLFNENYGLSQSAGVFTNNTQFVTISDCSFEDNIVTRGVIYPLNSTSTNIRNCQFLNNACASNTAFGGALFNWNSLNTYVDNCRFDGNSCGNGGASYVDGRNLRQGAIAITFNNCSFQNGEATDWGGGAIYGWRATMVFQGCEFIDNEAPNTGGAMYLGGNAKNITISDCSFEDNSAFGGWGGAHATYGDTSSIVVTNTSYSGNTASTSGGAVTQGFRTRASYTNCQFEANMASFGGASYAQNDSTKVNFESCSFFGNTATDFGGAINIASSEDHSIIECEFELNVSDNTGGAVSAFDSDATDDEVCSLTIMRSRFQENISQEQAGAIYLSDVQTNIVSSAVTDNSCLTTGNGGAISHNASASDSSILRIVNSTIANNFGILVDGISSWEESDTAKGEVQLINSILYHPAGKDWDIEAGNPELVSFGGNYATDDNLVGMLTNTQDEIGQTPGFVDAGGGDYHLGKGSVCVNTGLSQFAPPLDLDGNMREDEADKGAYEYQTAVSNKNFDKDKLEFLISPNPSMDMTRLRVDLAAQQRVILRVISNDGRLVMANVYQLKQGENDLTLQIGDLSSGQYTIEIIGKDVYGQQQLIKL